MADQSQRAPFHEYLGSPLTKDERIGLEKVQAMEAIRCGDYENLKRHLTRTLLLMGGNPNEWEKPVVDKPDHYQSENGVECIDVIKDITGKQYEGYLLGNIIKYVWRADLKNGKEDICKAIKYSEFLLEYI